MIQPFHKGSIEKLLLLKNRSPNQRNVCKFPRIALVSFNLGLYAPAQSRNQLQRFGFVHLVQIGNDHIEIELQGDWTSGASGHQFLKICSALVSNRINGLICKLIALDHIYEL